MNTFLIAKATDVGVARQVNEDSMTSFESPNGHVMAVCDGMGGQAAGDVASNLAVDIIENILKDNTFANCDEAIRRSIMAANQGVLNRTAQNPELEGMGSTCAMLIIKDGRVHCGWVGDSRIYYFSNHTLRQISHDQSYVQQLVDSGQISKTEAMSHPQKNEITNCIGLAGMSEPETTAVPIMPERGSIFLLCSDGLSTYVDENRIMGVLGDGNMSLQQKTDRLVEMANEAGGLDNITVELVQFLDNDALGNSNSESKTAHLQPKKSRTLLYGLLGAVLIAGASVGAYMLINKNKPEEPKTQAVKPPEGKGGGGVSSPSPEPSPGVITSTPGPGTNHNTSSTHTAQQSKQQSKNQNNGTRTANQIDRQAEKNNKPNPPVQPRNNTTSTDKQQQGKDIIQNPNPEPTPIYTGNEKD